MSMKMTVYVNYPGNCKQAMDYYKQHLGGTIDVVRTYEQMPGNPPAGLNKTSVLHARMTIGGATLMLSDGPPERVQPMRSAYLTLSADSSPEAERIHKALSDGGEVFMGMEETFFAQRFSMLRDKFGASWMVIHEKPMA